jgi:hypothetical protein
MTRPYSLTLPPPTFQYLYDPRQAKEIYPMAKCKSTGKEVRYCNCLDCLLVTGVFDY